MGHVKIIVHIEQGGQLPEEYSSKYLTKGVPKRGNKGDVILACVQHLNPENNLNMGVFQRANNFVNRKGPIPIFNVVHNNMRLPLVFKNFNVKDCSVLGISKIKTRNQFIDTIITDDDYITPGLMDKFDKRLDTVVKYGKLVRECDFRKDLSLKEFCDRFETKFVKDPDSHEEILYLSLRRDWFAGVHNAIRLVAHLRTARANPKHKKYWMYCKHLCLWLIPCASLKDLLPTSSLEEKDNDKYWIDKFTDFFENNETLVPLWVKRQYWKYDDESSSTDEENDIDPKTYTEISCRW